MEVLSANLGHLSVEHSPLSKRSTGYNQLPLMAPAPFTLTPINFTPPSTGKPLKVSFTTGGSHNGNPIYPATRLQLSLRIGQSEVFPDPFSVKDIRGDPSGNGVYSVSCLNCEVPRMRIPSGVTTTAEVRMYAWKRERLLGEWTVGELEGVGLAKR